MDSIRHQLRDVEGSLDEELKSVQAKLRRITEEDEECKKYAYITPEDVRTIPDMMVTSHTPPYPHARPRSLSSPFLRMKPERPPPAWRAPRTCIQDPAHV
jgi:hypothetical protein